MTTSVEPNQVDIPRRSRRALLAGGVGGFTMGIAALLGRANPVAAAAGDPIRIGQFNRAGSTRTTLQANNSEMGTARCPEWGRPPPWTASTGAPGME